MLLDIASIILHNLAAKDAMPVYYFTVNRTNTIDNSYQAGLILSPAKLYYTGATHLFYHHMH